MAYLHFSKEQLNNFSFSKEREFILTNNNGAYCSTTISTCNTRKYHGLLVVPQLQLDDQLHVLLSNLDETIYQKEHSFSLAVHQYPGIHHPNGNLLMEDFSYQQIPHWKFQHKSIVIEKEILICKDENRILLKYHLLETNEPIKMRFNPFLAFRTIHSLRKADLNYKLHTEPEANGMKFKMEKGYQALHMQFSKKTEFVSSPDWYYDVEYFREQERGYEFRESLLNPGYFEVTLKKGEELIFSAGTEEINTRRLKHIFTSEKESTPENKDFLSCLHNAAQQFVIKHNKKTSIIAGYHWFGIWGRDTFIALPGLTLSTGQPELFKKVVSSMLKDLKDGLFTNLGTGQNAAYNSADASLWFFWALQQYALYTKNSSAVWKDYKTKMISILEHYRKGTHYSIRMLDNGLIWSGENGNAVTWMDAIVNGKAVTPRIGLAVEINALWYNAIRFCLEAASAAEDESFVKEWKHYPEKIENSFQETFWNEEIGYLADYVSGDFKDWSIRPNQIIAASLPYSPVNEKICESIVAVVEGELLTSRGLRSLSPNDHAYQGNYFGDQKNRDLAYHQGIVWPWLLGHFSEAYLKINGKYGCDFIQSLVNGFEPSLFEYGIGTIAEIYSGDAPHYPCGAISQAWSVAELLRTNSLVEHYKHIELINSEATLVSELTK